MSGEMVIIEIDGSSAIGALYRADNTLLSVARVGYGSEDGPGGAVCELLSSLEEAAQEPTITVTAMKESLYLSLAPNLLNFRALELPFSEKSKVIEVLALELNGMLRVDIDDTVLDAILLGAGRVLAVAIEKSFLRSTLERLKEVDIEPVWIGSSLFAAPMITGNRTEGTLLTGARFIAAIAGGRPLFYNSISKDGGCSASLSYLKASGIGFDSVLTIGIDPEEIASVAGKGVEVKELSVGAAEGGLGGPDTVLLFALASQINANRLGENVNFRVGEFENRKGKKKVLFRLKITAVLAVMLISLVGFDLYLRYARYSGTLNAINRSMAQSYRGLFPDKGSGAVPDPLYLLETRLKQVEVESGSVTGVSPLTVLKRLSSAAAIEGIGEIKILSATVTRERISATGSAENFEAANKYKEALAALGIGTVRMADVKSRAGNGVGFSFTIQR